LLFIALEILMIKRIARKEFVEMLRDGRFRWSAAILLVLLPVSLLTGWRSYATFSILRAEAERSQREQWLGKKVANAHVAAHAGMTVYRPYLPLFAVDKGLDAYLGTSVFLEAHRRNPFQYAPAEYDARLQRFGEATAAVTMQLLVPLLIILLTYSAFAGERESGTLRQLLSLGVRRRDLALGKAIGATGPLAALLLPATIAGTVAISLNASPELRQFSLPRMALMALGYLGYFVVFVCIGLIVSAKARTAQRALVVSLAFWFVTCLLLPRITMTLARQIYPSPAARQFAQEIERAKREIPSFLERRPQVEKKLLAAYGVQNAKDLPISIWGTTLYEGEELEARTFNRLFQRLFDGYERQNRFYQRASLLSPLIAVQSLSMGMAGSDFDHHRHFADAAEAYRFNLVQTMNQYAINSRHYNTSISGRLNGPAFPTGERQVYEQIPPFKYTPPDWWWSVDRLKIAVAALTLWQATALIAVLRMITKMKVG
jgi:ABC-2 type transport system permease protein